MVEMAVGVIGVLEQIGMANQMVRAYFLSKKYFHVFLASILFSIELLAHGDVETRYFHQFIFR